MENKNGCFNREPVKETLIVQSGWRYTPDGLGGSTRMPTFKQVNHKFKDICVYSINMKDVRCNGCKHNQNKS